jgi:hypothetical protein
MFNRIMTISSVRTYYYAIKRSGAMRWALYELLAVGFINSLVKLYIERRSPHQAL